jgi:hypothetical protein
MQPVSLCLRGVLISEDNEILKASLQDEFKGDILCSLYVREDGSRAAGIFCKMASISKCNNLATYTAYHKHVRAFTHHTLLARLRSEDDSNALL